MKDKSEHLSLIPTVCVKSFNRPLQTFLLNIHYNTVDVLPVSPDLLGWFLVCVQTLSNMVKCTIKKKKNHLYYGSCFTPFLFVSLIVKNGITCYSGYKSLQNGLSYSQIS